MVKPFQTHKNEAKVKSNGIQFNRRPADLGRWITSTAASMVSSFDCFFLFLGTTRNEMVFIFVEKWGEKNARRARSSFRAISQGRGNEKWREKKMKGNDTARKKSQIIFSEKANLFLLFHRYRMKSTQTECYLLIYSEKKCTDFL